MLWTYSPNISPNIICLLSLQSQSGIIKNDLLPITSRYSYNGFLWYSISHKILPYVLIRFLCPHLIKCLYWSNKVIEIRTALKPKMSNEAWVKGMSLTIRRVDSNPAASFSSWAGPCPNDEIYSDLAVLLVWGLGECWMLCVFLL